MLLAHRLRQDEERRAWGRAYVEHGLVFARADGQPISPEHVSKRFRELSLAAGLRPVRLHDLRHGAGSLRLAAGVELSLISKHLGHSTFTLTSDTCSHLLEDVGRQAPEKAMALVPRALRDPSAGSCDQSLCRRSCRVGRTCSDLRRVGSPIWT